jgi:hypothetical protein
MACGLRRYFREVFIEVNFAFKLVPIPLTAARMTMEIPAAMSPYSIAVAPESSAKKFEKICFTSPSRFDEVMAHNGLQSAKAG